MGVSTTDNRQPQSRPHQPVTASPCFSRCQVAINAENTLGQALTRPLLPLSIHLVPLGIAFDKIHAQQTPAILQLGLGFEAVRKKFQKVDEAGKKFGHG